MQKVIHTLIFLFCFGTANALTYNECINLAWEKYEQKQYEASAKLYELAFVLDTSRKYTDDFYNAMCSWALAGNDSLAFINLDKAIAIGFLDIERLQKDKDLKSLYSSSKWPLVVDKINEYKIQKQLTIKKNEPTFYWGVYLGILVVFFFYNLILGISLRDITFFYYSASIFFLAQLHTLIIKPFGDFSKELFFWFEYIKLTTNISFAVGNLMIIFHLLFVSKFLNLKEIAPRLYKINKGFVIYLSVFTLCLIFGPRSFDIVFFLSAIVAYFFPLYAGIVCWRRRYRPAKYLVLSSVFLTLGVSLILISNLLGLDLNLQFGVYRLDNIAFILFYGFLSFALGDKINILKQDKLEAQEKAMLVLEERVNERTIEVVKQKEIIEQKNKDITDSIHYAKRIQQALLPTFNYIDKSLKRLQKKEKNKIID